MRDRPVAREVAGRTLEISHPDAVLFPHDGIRKIEVVDHYLSVAEVMVPHVRDRPLTMHRFPDGVGAQGFYHKAAPEYFPDWVPRVRVKTTEGSQEQVVANDAATLAYLADQRTVVPHVWASRADDLDHPDQLIFDLDPSDDDFEPVRDAARSLRGILREVGLVPFLKTSGSTGLHVQVPLDRSADFDAARSFARTVAQVLVARDPHRLTLEQRKRKRAGRVYVDVMRNAYGQTVVPPYAVRALPGAPVAAPLEWEELGSRRLTPRRWTIRSIRRRLARRDDPWADMPRHARPLRDAARALEAVGER